MLFFAAEFFNQLEQRSGDLVWRLGASRVDERRLIVVDVDERSLREVGPWPWPHDTQARLIEQIAAAGARQQIFDVVFTDAQGQEQAFVKPCSSISQCCRRSSRWSRAASRQSVCSRARWNGPPARSRLRRAMDTWPTLLRSSRLIRDTSRRVWAVMVWSDTSRPSSASRANPTPPWALPPSCKAHPSES
ncbi:MAG: CHASE2 domain-containing protein [Rhodoferax sp.]|nr:CHASE2 domain-containing protein [Rhodoferax sp.]